jgi:hypothetical protein
MIEPDEPKAGPVQVGFAAISLAYIAATVGIAGYFIFFHETTPMTPAKKAELRQMLLEDATKQARNCEETIDAMRKLSPDVVGKDFIAARRSCWDDWHKIMDDF